MSQLTITNETNETPAKGSWRKIRQDEYETIKMLLEAGVKTSTIARIQNRSANTIGKISKSTSLQDYRRTSAAERRKYSKVVVNPPKSTEEVPAETSVTQQGTGRPEVDSLERIANALERLADAWERKPEKKSSFFGN